MAGSDVRAGPSAMSTRFSQRAYSDLVLGQLTCQSCSHSPAILPVQRASLGRGASGAKYIPVLLIFLWSYFEPVPFFAGITHAFHLLVHSLTYNGNPSFTLLHHFLPFVTRWR